MAKKKIRDQREVYLETLAIWNRTKTDFAAKDLETLKKLLKELYADRDGVALSFYAVGQAEKIHHCPDQPIYDCTLIHKNRFEQNAWKGQPKPPGHPPALRWPPRTIQHLLGNPPPNEECIGCNQNTPCNCEYSDGLDRNKIWAAFTMIKPHLEYGGHGLYAAFHDIDQNTILGEYTGEVLPEGHPKLSTSHYVVKLPLGSSTTAACIDAQTTGSFARFMNHSCTPNAELLQYRQGPSRQLVGVRTISLIRAGDEITIKYADDWDGDSICDCRKPTCKLFQSEQKKKAAEKKAAEKKADAEKAAKKKAAELKSKKRKRDDDSDESEQGPVQKKKKAEKKAAELKSKKRKRDNDSEESEQEPKQKKAKQDPKQKSKQDRKSTPKPTKRPRAAVSDDDDTPRRSERIKLRSSQSSSSKGSEPIRQKQRYRRT